MNYSKLAVRCTGCGTWRALATTNVLTAKFICFSCGKTCKIRNRKGWNVEVVDMNKPEYIKIPEDIIVANLNASNRGKKK